MPCGIVFDMHNLGINPKSSNDKQKAPCMFLNYIKTAWRILQKNLSHTIINIIGLGVGFSVATLLLIFIFHQLSYDRFHEHSHRIYRMTVEGHMGNDQYISAPLTDGEVADIFKEQLPEAEYVSRLFTQGTQEVFVDNERFAIDQLVWVDPGFFHMFSFPLSKGDPEQVLDSPDQVVLSEDAALQFFGSTDVINETMFFANRTYRITGIMENFPANSHVQFTVVASIATRTRPEDNIIPRQGISFPTYVLLREDADKENFVNNAVRLADLHVEEKYGPMGLHINHHVQNLEDIYLHSRFAMVTEETGDIRNVYIFSFLTLFILLIAIFNFVNLMTAQAEKRSREIGLRKVIGAGKGDLIRQFMGESVIIALLAFLLALALNEFLIHPFSHMLDEDFSLLYWQQPIILLAILAFVVIIGIISGIYPALYLSRHQPITVLKGDQHGTGKPNAFRKVLVSVQFAISIFLIATLLLLHKQVSDMKHKNPGFEREHVISVTNLTSGIRGSYESIRAELLQHPRILQVTASQSIPGRQRSIQTAHKQEDDPDQTILIHENRIQHHYLETYGMQLVAGRDFDPQMRTDSASVIVNERAVKELGLEDPIGADIVVWQHPCRIIGVVSDFHFQSLHHKLEPLAFTMYSTWFNQISIRMEPGSTREVMDFTQETFESADPNYVFDYLFIDSLFEQMYRREERISNMVTAAAILAIIISFMGLFALTSFTVSQKVKEIGIRKTFGASTFSVVASLTKELSRWLIAGAIVALPLAYWVVDSWQQNFAYQISLLEHWWLFAAAVLIAGAIGGLAMLYQSLSAARANPMDSLRTE